MTPRFILTDRDTDYLLPPSVNDWLADDHLARFVVDVVDQLDLRALVSAYRGRGKAAHHPSVLVALLFYGYATGVFSSRQLERASYDSVAFRYICANTHPDHDTIASFRRRFGDELQGLCVQILQIAHGLGLLKLGRVSLDGTKIKANASKHKALSYGRACALEAALKDEVAQLLQLAESADTADVPDGMDIPEELARREQRLRAIAVAKAEIEVRAAERHARAQAEFEDKQAKRDAQRAAGQKPRGREPTPPEAGPAAQDQVNLTDPESRIMPSSGGGFVQAYNAQASVDQATQLIVAGHLTHKPNDKQEIAPAVAALQALPTALGRATDLAADTGYFSQTNVGACEAAGIDPYIAVNRQTHHIGLMERFAGPEPLPANATPAQQMSYKLGTADGKAIYGRRKSTVEPVFGIIKHVMGFRRFQLRGIAGARIEWSLVSMAWNLKRMHVLAA